MSSTQSSSVAGSFRQSFIVVTILIAAAFYLSIITRTIQYDEAFTLHNYAVDPARAIIAYATPNNQLLHTFGLWFVTFLAGDSLVALRFVAFGAALVTLALAYRIGGRLVNAQAGLLAAGTLAVNYTFADYAVSARGYTLCMALTLAMIDVILFAWPGRRIRYTLMLLSAALVLTIPSMAVLLAAIAASLLFRWADRRYRDSLVALVVGGLCGTLFYVPALLFGSLARSVEAFGLAGIWQLLREVGSLLFPSDILGGLFLALVIVGGVASWRLSRSATGCRSAHLAAYVQIIGLALVWALGLAVVQWVFTGRVFFARNYLYLLPMFCVVAGWAVSLARNAWRWRVVFALNLLFVFIGVSYVPMLSRPSDVDAVMALIDQNAQPTDVIAAGCCIEEPIRYMLNHSGREQMLRITPETQRAILISTAFAGMASVRALFEGVDLHTCNEAPEWQPYEVMQCRITSVRGEDKH